MLYDARAEKAGFILQLLAIGNWFLSIESANSAALLALGKPKWLAFGNGAKVAGMAVAIPAGAVLYGFPGAVLGFSASEVFKYVVSAIGARREGLAGVRQDLVLTAGVVASAGLGIATSALLERLAFHNVRAQAFVEGAVLFVVLGLAWLGSYAATRRHHAGAVR
jgi:O-antigen/teichoic acid export membrane protein